MASTCLDLVPLSAPQRPVYLDAGQAERFRLFFKERIYRYEFGQCDLPIAQLISRLRENLVAKGVFLKGGGALRILTGRTHLSDLDLHFEIDEPQSWRRVENIFLDTLRRFSRIDPARDGGRTARILVKDQHNSFAIHRLPTLIGETPQEIDLIFHVRSQNGSFGSADALQINLEALSNPSIGMDRIEVKAIDGYDPRKCLRLMRKHQFTVEPIERIGTILNGLRGYCRIISRGYYPNPFHIERRYWEAFRKEENDLLTYLARHYPADPKGQLIYCLNYYAILARQNEELPNLKRLLFQQVCISLGRSVSEFSDNDQLVFPKLAQQYLYLRAPQRTELQKEGVTFFPIEKEEGGFPTSHYLLIATPRQEEISLREIDSHPLMREVKKMFPCAFQPKVLPQPEPLIPLSELCKTGPIKAVIARYRKEADPSLLEGIAQRSVPAFFALLPLTPYFDRPFMKPMFESFPERGIPFLLKTTPAIARKYLHLDHIQPLEKQFGERLFIDEETGELCEDLLERYVQHRPRQEAACLYHQLEERMMQSRDPLKYLSLFLPVSGAKLIEKMVQVNPKELSRDQIERRLALCEKLEKQISSNKLKDVYLFHLHLLALYNGEVESRKKIIPLFQSAFARKAIRGKDLLAPHPGRESDHLISLIAALTNRQDTMDLCRELCAISIQNSARVEDQERIRLYETTHVPLLITLFFTRRSIEEGKKRRIGRGEWVAYLESIIRTASRIGAIEKGDPSWNPIKERIFELYCLIKPELSQPVEEKSPDPLIAHITQNYQTPEDLFKNLYL